MIMEPFQIVSLALAVLIFNVAVYFAYQWRKIKASVAKAHKCLEVVDIALADDNVSEEEFRQIWSRCYSDIFKG